MRRCTCQSAERNGVDIWYEVAGDGPAMVLVHANPFDHDLWMYQTAHFSTWFKVVGIDIRGYGRSAKVTTPYALKDMCDDVVGVMKDLGIARAVLCGCSVGSGIALLLALDRPDLFEAVILVGGNSSASARYQGRIDGYRANLADYHPRHIRRTGAARIRRQPAGPPSARDVPGTRSTPERRGDRAGVHGRQSHRYHAAAARR